MAVIVSARVQPEVRDALDRLARRHRVARSKLLQDAIEGLLGGEVPCLGAREREARAVRAAMARREAELRALLQVRAPDQA